MKKFCRLIKILLSDCMAASIILEEGKEIVKWIRNKKVNAVATILFGSAARGWKEAEDLDVLVVLDGTDEDVNKLLVEFNKESKRIEKQGLYPELTILKKNSIGKGNPSFYYSIIRDGINLTGDKSLFIKALVELEGKKAFLKACGLDRAYGFLKHAEEDLKRAKEVTDIQLVAEGAYRACVEAIYVLSRKHGMPIPGDHKEESERLSTLDEIYPSLNLSPRYFMLFQNLHADCFYHGDCGAIKDWLTNARKFIDDIAKVL